MHATLVMSAEVKLSGTPLNHDLQSEHEPDVCVHMPSLSCLFRFVGGVTPEISEEDIHDHFYAFGELVSVKKVDAKSCAFITYNTR